MRTNAKIFFTTLLVFACLSNCNRSRFGGSGDETSRSAGVDIVVKKISNSSTVEKGKGQVRVSASYPLQLTCTNCPELGFTLLFNEAPMEANRYVYSADFDYSLVTAQTEVCAVILNVVSKNSKAISSVKTYNIYVCPRQGAQERCDIDSAVPSCAHIGR